jgi:hypothetical protein
LTRQFDLQHPRRNGQEDEGQDRLDQVKRLHYAFSKGTGHAKDWGRAGQEPQKTIKMPNLPEKGAKWPILGPFWVR